MSYRVRYTDSGLCSPTFHDARESAVAEGNKAKEPFAVQTIRRPRLSDFVNHTALLGDIRENIAQTTGDDSVLDEGKLKEAIASGAFSNALDGFMDAFCEHVGVVIPGAIVVSESKP